jgi:hypothetical protein
MYSHTNPRAKYWRFCTIFVTFNTPPLPILMQTLASALAITTTGFNQRIYPIDQLWNLFVGHPKRNSTRLPGFVFSPLAHIIRLSRHIRVKRQRNALSTVRRLLRCLGHFRLLSVRIADVITVMMAVFVMECLQREASVSLFTPSPSLGYVRIILAHSPCFINL